MVMKGSADVEKSIPSFQASSLEMNREGRDGRKKAERPTRKDANKAKAKGSRLGKMRESRWGRNGKGDLPIVDEGFGDEDTKDEYSARAIQKRKASKLDHLLKRFFVFKISPLLGKRYRWKNLNWLAVLLEPDDQFVSQKKNYVKSCMFFVYPPCFGRLNLSLIWIVDKLGIFWRTSADCLTFSLRHLSQKTTVGKSCFS